MLRASRQCFALLLGVGVFYASSASTKDRNLDFCELISKASELDGKVVTVKTNIIMAGLHGATAIPGQSDSCSGAVNLVTPARDSLSGDMKEFLRAQVIGGFYIATITGRFESHPHGLADAPNVKGLLRIETVSPLKRERRLP